MVQLLVEKVIVYQDGAVEVHHVLPFEEQPVAADQKKKAVPAEFYVLRLKHFHRPTHPVPGHSLACAGKVLAATIRSVTAFGTHQLDLAHMAQVARGVSDAKVYSLAFIATRRQTNGVPLELAMTTEKRVDMAPLLRCGGGQVERFRFDTAGCTQGNNAVPAFVGDGLLDLFSS